MERIGERAINSFGRIDTWFNNAGVSVYGKLLDVPLEDQRRVFDTNFWGVVHGSRTAVRFMRTGGGVLINMGSVVSDRAVPLQGIYAASKHAIKAYTDTLRMELEHDRVPIAVTLIKPGAIDTPYYQHAKNYMSEEPAPPPPVYSADTVARAVCECAERPVRDITIGGGGRMIATMGSLAPRLTDLVHGTHDVRAAEERPAERSPRQPAHHQRQRRGVGRVRGSRDAVERLHARDAVGRRTRAPVPRARRRAWPPP